MRAYLMHVSENDMCSIRIHPQPRNNNLPHKNLQFSFILSDSVRSVKSAFHDLLSGPRFSEVLPRIKINQQFSSLYLLHTKCIFKNHAYFHTIDTFSCTYFVTGSDKGILDRGNDYIYDCVSRLQTILVCLARRLGTYEKF